MTTATIIGYIAVFAAGIIAKLAHGWAIAPKSGGTSQASQPSAPPNVALSTQAHVAGLDALVALFKAIETANGPLILQEAEYLSRLVSQYGGFAQLLDNAVTQVLEQRLAAGQSVILDQVASASGVTSRQLLDALEGKPGAAAGVLAAIRAIAKPAVATLLLCFLPSLASAETWGMPVKGPQRFYEKPSVMIQDEPLMRDARGQLVPFQAIQARQVSASPVQPPEGSYYQPVNSRGGWHPGTIVSAPFRWFGHRRWRLFGRRGC